jgi:DNA glycosylase AlkZ-like
VRRITVEARRSRLGLRHLLARPTNSPVEVAASLNGLHGTDPASVYLASSARMRELDFAMIERALYDDRSLVRMLGMRRTMWVLPLDLAAIVQAAATNQVAARERRKLEQMITGAEITADAAAWLAHVEQATLTALAARGEATGADLSGDVPELREQFVFGVGTKWEGAQSVTTRLLLLLAAERKIVRARPRGSWISSQYRWTPMEAWLSTGLDGWTREEAQVELARRWLGAYGPATLADLKWWTGWTVTETRRALGEIALVEVDLGGETGVVLAEDTEPAAAVEPWVALLPALDPTVMGWSSREWYLGDHGPALFDRSGNAGPTVWSDGRIVGGWGQRPDGEVVFRLLEDVGSDTLAAVETASERLAELLGDTRVTPRFRTPLERELSG